MFDGQKKIRYNRDLADGYTQKTIAERHGLSRGYISKIKLNNRRQLI